MFIYLFSVWSSHLTVSHLGVTDSVFFPNSIWNVSVFQAHPFFLRCCFLFAFLTCFKLSAWISYLVFKLEVVVTAECQMFRLSCLQHILMWIYWWMRRKFLIKSTVQSKTPISFDEVLKLLIAQSWSSVPCAALQMSLFGSSLGLLLWAPVWGCRQWPVPFLIYPIHPEHGHALDFNTILVRFLWAKPHFCAKLGFGTWCFWGRLEIDCCALMIQAKPLTHRWLPCSQSPLGTELQFQLKKRNGRYNNTSKSGSNKGKVTLKNK